MCLQSSGKLEMERGMVKPMIRGEQQDSRSDADTPASSIFLLPAAFGLVLLFRLPFSRCYFVLTGLRTAQQTEQSWPCLPASSSETTVSINASHSASLLTLGGGSDAVNNWKLLNPPCYLCNVVDWFRWTKVLEHTVNVSWRMYSKCKVRVTLRRFPLTLLTGYISIMLYRNRYRSAQPDSVWKCFPLNCIKGTVHLNNSQHSFLLSRAIFRTLVLCVLTHWHGLLGHVQSDSQHFDVRKGFLFLC